MRNEGHSGQYKADVFDFVFDGMMHCEFEGKFKRKELVLDLLHFYQVEL